MKRSGKGEAVHSSRELCELIAYDRDGNEFERVQNFQPGRSTITRYIRERMRAMRLVDGNGEVVGSWDPWDILP